MVDIDEKPIDTEQTRIARRYLLGELSTAEKEAFESRYFEDPELFHELGTAENDLIDSYVRNGLPERERENFESHFLRVPSRIERVKFARTLREYAGIAGHRNPSTSWSLVRNARSVGPRLWLQRPGLQWAAACFVLLVSGSAAWFAYNNQQLRSRLYEAQAQQGELRGHEQELNRRLEEAQVQHHQEQPGTGEPVPLAAQLRRPGTPLVILSLATDNFRGMETMPTLPLAPGISNVVLFLNQAPEKPGPYDLSIETAEGQQIFKKRAADLQHVSADGKTIALELPGAIFKSGDYILSLAAQAEGNNHDAASASYDFRVKVGH